MHHQQIAIMDAAVVSTILYWVSLLSSCCYYCHSALLLFLFCFHCYFGVQMLFRYCFHWYFYCCFSAFPAAGYIICSTIPDSQWQYQLVTFAMLVVESVSSVSSCCVSCSNMFIHNNNTERGNTIPGSNILSTPTEEGNKKAVIYSQ